MRELPLGLGLLPALSLAALALLLDARGGIELFLALAAQQLLLAAAHLVVARAGRPFLALAAVAQLGAVAFLGTDIAAGALVGHLAAATVGATALGLALAAWPRGDATLLAASTLALGGLAAFLPPIGPAPLPPWPSEVATAGAAALVGIIVTRWLLASTFGAALGLAGRDRLVAFLPGGPRLPMALGGVVAGALAGAAGAIFARIESPGIGELGEGAPVLSLGLALAAALGGRRGLGGTLLVGFLLVGLPRLVTWLWPRGPDLALPLMAAGGVLLLLATFGRRAATAHG
jgi:hypothetical protein